MVGREAPNSAAIWATVWTRRPSAELVVHVLGDLGLAGRELGLLRAGAAPCPGRGQAVTGAL